MGKEIEKDSARIQYLQMIQSSIERMSTSSAIFKGFSATIVAGISMISYCQQNTWIVMLSFVPVLVFAVLDVYYLWLERKMRYLYKQVKDRIHPCDFDMEITVNKANYKEANLRICDLVNSPSIKWFYPVMIAILMIVLGFKIGGVV